MIKIGISGWSYPGWRGTFYPPKLPQRRELEYASRALPTIEVNGTFYSLQKPASYRSWYERTPEDFVFTLKAHRYITHYRRLKDVRVPVANFFASGVLELAGKLGPILWQFPPNLRFDPDHWEAFLELLPMDMSAARRLGLSSELRGERRSLRVRENHPLRHAVEVRHESFLNPWFVDLLRAHGVALVFADTAGKWPYFEDLTADFVYVRLHGDAELYVSGYDQSTLNFWAKRLRTWETGERPEKNLTISEKIPRRRHRDVFVYFDNDAKVRAPADARSLIRILHGPGFASERQRSVS